MGARRGFDRSRALGVRVRLEDWMDEIVRLSGKLIGCLIMTALVLLCIAAVLWCLQLVVGLVA